MTQSSESKSRYPDLNLVINARVEANFVQTLSSSMSVNLETPAPRSAREALLNLTMPALQLFVGCQNSRNFQWDEEVTGEDIVVKVTERRRRLKLAGRNPSVCIGPLPSDGFDALNRLLKVLCAHRISVHTDVLR